MKEKNLATFGAGCFWGVEETFRRLEGILKTSVGFMGGSKEKPTYHEVCGGNTGHAEVLQLEYDPEKIAYEKLLQVFWESHNPTQVNRQGPDIGEQYRSAIFYHSAQQKEQAEKSKKALSASGKFDKDITTAIEPATIFYRAEEYHQRYLEKRGGGACHI